MEIEPPECPVCLQYYDGDTTVPRVLSCGHSACETCLSNLHKHHLSSSSLPNTLRCPSCTQLLPFPHPFGAAALPKNIDILRFSLRHSQPNATPKPRRVTPPPELLWSHQLYSSWKDWILPYAAVLGGVIVDGADFTLSEMMRCRLVWDQEVGFVRIGRFESGDSVFQYGYTGKIMSILGRMSGDLRDEIKSLLGFSLRIPRVCNVLGLWFDEKVENNGVLYLVTVKLKNGLLNLDDFRWSIGVQLCKGLISLNLEGVVCGCLGLSCIFFDEFGDVCIDLGEALCVGGKFRECVVEGVLGGRRNEEAEVDALIVKMSNMGAFVPPEMVLELLRRERFEVEKNDASFTICCESDVWLLACVLIRLLVGNQFSVEMYNYLKPVFQGDNAGVFECKDIYLQWVDSIEALLQPLVISDCASIYEILIKCLDFDPKSRPIITHVWECMNGLNKDHCIKHVTSLNSTKLMNKGYQCLVLGDLCNMSNDRRHESRMYKLREAQDDCNAELSLARKAGVGDVAMGLSTGNVQCKTLQGHLDSITGFCVGGGYLFSSSFDKTINVWSLQDFAHVHTFRGHENRVMALVYVNDEKPLCISADIGGGIFAWEINEPLSQEPLKKWFEDKDWRYSGIHALAVSESGFLYTGSGDRLIKAWLLSDYTLVCCMEGHKSVVSTLALSNGVLYSGSWDGTVRLWCLHDHSPLAVFGEDIHGTVSPVHSLYAYQNMTIAAYENGCMKIWVNDVLKTSKIQEKAILALAMEGKWLFSGGWDRAVKFQEVTREGFEINIIEVGSFTCDSVITALLCEQGILFVGCANKLIKVYYCDT